jgi:hypothetical protein
MLLEHDGLDDQWIEDDEDIMPEYGVLFEEVAEVRARQGRTNEQPTSGVRSAAREEYGVDDEEAMLSGVSDTTSFRERRVHITSHYNRMLRKRTVMF